MERLLVHVCCACCLGGLLDRFRDLKVDETGFFCNANIHPFLEFKKRLRAVQVLSEIESFPMVYDETYGLKEFLGKINYEGSDRCRECYGLRLTKTALYARDNGFDSFTTTMLISNQQKVEVIREVAETIASQTGVGFFYEDFRHLQARGLEIAKKRSLYRQQYCGCIFSEYERFKDKADYLNKRHNQ